MENTHLILMYGKILHNGYNNGNADVLSHNMVETPYSPMDETLQAVEIANFMLVEGKLLQAYTLIGGDAFKVELLCWMVDRRVSR